MLEVQARGASAFENARNNATLETAGAVDRAPFCHFGGSTATAFQDRQQARE